jgi:hypothetical protein
MTRRGFAGFAACALCGFAPVGLTDPPAPGALAATTHDRFLAARTAYEVSINELVEGQEFHGLLCNTAQECQKMRGILFRQREACVSCRAAIDASESWACQAAARTIVAEKSWEELRHQQDYEFQEQAPHAIWPDGPADANGMTVDELRSAIGNSGRCKRWFGFAEDLSQSALDIFKAYESPIDDRQRSSMAAFMTHVHQRFLASVRCIKKARIRGVRNLLRGAAEDAVALTALAADPKFLLRLIAAHRLHNLKTARWLLADAKYRQHVAVGQLQILEDMTKIQSSSAEPDMPCAIDWIEVAQPHVNSIYLIPLLRTEAAQSGSTLTKESWENVGPMEDTMPAMASSVRAITEAVDTLSASCSVLICAAEAFVSVVDRDCRQAAKVRAHWAIYHALKAQESTGDPCMLGRLTVHEIRR